MGILIDQDSSGNGTVTRVFVTDYVSGNGKTYDKVLVWSWAAHIDGPLPYDAMMKEVEHQLKTQGISGESTAG